MSQRDTNDFGDCEQVPFYNPYIERCDLLASQLYALETKYENVVRERDFYIKLYEAGVAPIFSNV